MAAREEELICPVWIEDGSDQQQGKEWKIVSVPLINLLYAQLQLSWQVVIIGTL
jgi:hypothetical protein